MFHFFQRNNLLVSVERESAHVTPSSSPDKVYAPLQVATPRILEHSIVVETPSSRPLQIDDEENSAGPSTPTKCRRTTHLQVLVTLFNIRVRDETAVPAIPQSNSPDINPGQDEDEDPAPFQVASNEVTFVDNTLPSFIITRQEVLFYQVF